MTAHANCQDSLAEAIREYRLTPDDVHDSFNLWMATTIDETGRRQFKWNPARKGDRIDLLAMFDLVGINNYTFASVRLEIFEASPASVQLTDRIEDRWGRLASHLTSDDLAEVPALATRELRNDPGYVPRYRPMPSRSTLELELNDDERALVQGLVATGVYGETEGEAIRAGFMRWCNSHLTRIRRPLVAFTS